MTPSGAAKNILVLLLGISLIFVAEGTLTLLGVAPLSGNDRFAGFAGSGPVFLPRQGSAGAVYELNPMKDRHFNPQSFRMPKPPDSFRMVAFGGSTTYGRPYIHGTSFPAWLAKLLDQLDPDHRFESINLGGISYASYRVRRLMEEAAGYDPDLFVIYAGHNEFLEARTFEKLIEEPPALRRTRGFLHRSRLYTVLHRSLKGLMKAGQTQRADQPGGEVVARLEEIGGTELYHRDGEFRAGVIRQYRESLEGIIRFCQQRGVPLILCTLPSNLAGVSPFKSEHGVDLDGESMARWTRLYTQADAALERGSPQLALDRLDEALSIDDQHAGAHYLRGSALRSLGRFQEAYGAFVRAKEEDIIPLRALEVFNASLREFAAAHQIPLADVEARFRREAPNGIPGAELFADHVHPTLKGQQLIAWVVAETAVRSGVVPVSAEEWNDSTGHLMEFLATEYAQISDRYRAMGLWGVGRLYHWAGKYPEAHRALSEAWHSVRDVGEIPRLLGELELRRGEPEDALALFREAERLAQEPELTALGIAKAHIALGDGSEALRTLGETETGSPASPTRLGLRGQAKALTGDLDGAVRDLEAALETAPGSRRFLHALARAQLRQGDVTSARETFRRIRAEEHAAWSEEAWSEFQTQTPLSGR